MPKPRTQTKQITLRTSDGRLVGVLRGNVFKKRVHESKHLFRAVGATGSWGMDYDILFNQLPEKCVVMIDDLETRKHYQIPTRIWRANGIIMHFKQNTKDHYTQVFLPRSFFQTFAPA